MKIFLAVWKKMETFGSLYEESVVPSISYTLGKVSNALSDRREVKIKPRGGTTYSSRGAKTIEFTITDSNSYMLWNTLKFQCKMRNTSAVADNLDLEFLGPCPNERAQKNYAIWGFCRTLRTKFHKLRNTDIQTLPLFFEFRRDHQFPKDPW